MAEIYDLVRRGNKIEAIKLYRNHTNLGLAEAKAAIDALEIKLKLR
jgi:ribosomal protein L7/L12